MTSCKFFIVHFFIFYVLIIFYSAAFLLQNQLTVDWLIDWLIEADVVVAVWHRRSWRRTSYAQSSCRHNITMTTACEPSSQCSLQPGISSWSTRSRMNPFCCSKPSWMSTCPSFSHRLGGRDCLADEYQQGRFGLVITLLGTSTEFTSSLLRWVTVHGYTVLVFKYQATS